MDSTKIAVIAVFTALTVALNLSPIKIPAPYAPFLIYQIWEIPIVAAFLLYGLKVGTAISIFNTALLLAVYPGVLPTGPLYNLAAVFSMLVGVFVTYRVSVLCSRPREFTGLIATVVTLITLYSALQPRFLDVTIILIFVELVSWIIFLIAVFSLELKVVLPVVSTTVGVIFRVGAMTVVNWAFLPFPPPIGFGLPMSAVIAALPIIGVFNATLAFYTIPLGHFLAQTVTSSLKAVGLTNAGDPHAENQEAQVS